MPRSKQTMEVKPERKTSKYRGVYWCTRDQRWGASITSNRKTRALGRFDAEIDAARAYDDAARTLYGDFAQLNFPTAAEKDRADRMITREEAWERFGVGRFVWWRWEKEGLITCGQRASGPGCRKLYRVEDIEALVEKYGVLAPPYPDPDRPGVHRVPLGGRDIARQEAIIDSDCLPLIQDAHCHMASTRESVDFVAVSKDGKHMPLRRLIMGVTDRNRQVGHRNGDPLDCRRENLIVRTTRQRVWTKCKSEKINGRKPTSRFKGVFWETYTGKWRARITAQGKNHSLGRFHDEVAAAEAYDAAARRFFGEHAWLNFPQEGERGRTESDVLEIAGSIGPGEEEHLKDAA